MDWIFPTALSTSLQKYTTMYIKTVIKNAAKGSRKHQNAPPVCPMKTSHTFNVICSRRTLGFDTGCPNRNSTQPAFAPNDQYTRAAQIVSLFAQKQYNTFVVSIACHCKKLLPNARHLKRVVENNCFYAIKMFLYQDFCSG
ncbi:MAG: hypothetical protein JW934_10545 [Anaerolineae bacterium]|nr:hypothetical protein [Anaerolineae bacterium]